jgi:type II secretory pathway predicted ATPase ExeA
MIQEFFELQRRPFISTPAPEQFFPASSAEAARTSLVRLIERNEGPGLVIGPVGTGKSILCQLLAQTFRHRYRVVLAPPGRLTDRRALLQTILFELGLPYRNLDEVELRLSLIDHVTNRELCPRGLLLLVDDAECLSPSLLNELRALASLTWDGGGCVRMVLFGSPRLEEKFTHPQLESFNQRIIGRYYLDPFTSHETRRYIEQSFAACGGDPYDVFTPAALQKIHDACGGIPRLINQLADHALVLTAIGNHELVDSACVDDAWADLQQLPLPHGRMPASPHAMRSSEIVEFGNLEDETSDSKPEPHLAEKPGQVDGMPAEGGSQVHAESSLDHTPDVAESDSECDCRTPSEYTLVFHSAANPFGDDFEEEEVVVDHFVSPDALTQRHRRQVVAAASERLAEQMHQLRQQAAAGRSRHGETAPSVEPTTVDSTGEQAAVPTTPSIIHLREHATTSHEDQLAVSTCKPAIVPSNSRVDLGDAPGPASPRNYHKLFSQLRRRG